MVSARNDATLAAVDEKAVPEQRALDALVKALPERVILA